MIQSGSNLTWREEKLKNMPIELIDGDRSSRYPKKTEFQENGIPFLNTTAIRDNKIDLSEINFINIDKFNKINKGRLERLDIVMTTRGNGIGKVALFDCRYPTGLINAQMLILRAENEEIDSRYLYYVLCNSSFQETVKNFTSGSAQPQIPIQSLREITIKYPPLPTQRKIASILSAYDDLIENNTRRIKILEEMAQALYREWFVRFRFPGHEKVRMVDSSMGKIPEGWEIKKLGDTCQIVMGQSPKSEYYNEIGEGLPFDQGVTDFGSRFPTDRIYCTVLNRIAEAGDILFSVRAPVGRINLVNKKIVIGRGLCAIRSKNNCQAFIHQQLRNKFKEEDTMGSGTIFKSVIKEDMNNIVVVIPSWTLIARFEDFMRPVFQNLSILTAKNNNLHKTRDLLLPKLISGKFSLEN